jgi:hypothetical protein
VLLSEAGAQDLPPVSGVARAQGIEVAPDESDVGSPETYVGYERASNFVSPIAVAPDKTTLYKVPGSLQLNQWSLGGTWTVGAESAESLAAGDRIVFHFHARDLHLVLAPGTVGRAVRFRVTLDGHEPGEDHGADTDAHGNGSVHGQRLYQLIRQSGAIQDRTFSIEFLDAGVRAYAFTFG